MTASELIDELMNCEPDAVVFYKIGPNEGPGELVVSNVVTETRAVVLS